MKHIALGAILVGLLAGGPAAAQIVRHPNPAPALILNGVTVPANAQTLYLSGMVASPIDPAKSTNLADFGDTKTQTVSALLKIKASLEKQGYTMSDVVKLTVFLAGEPRLAGKMDFAGFNDGYKQFFGSGENPNLVARSTVQVTALAAPYLLVEIEATAAKVPGPK